MLFLLSVGAWEVAFARSINYGIPEIQNELENNALEYVAWKHLSKH